MINPDGSFEVLVEFLEHLDWDRSVDAICQLAQGGGGRLYEVFREDGYPGIEVVHRALIDRFQELSKILTSEFPDAESTQVSNTESMSEWSEYFSRARELLVISWYEQADSIALICQITDEGGTIDVLRNGQLNPDLI